MAQSIQYKEHLSSRSSRLHYVYQPWILFANFYRAKIITVEPIMMMALVAKYIYTPLYEQYYYLTYGMDILKNTSFISPNHSFCMSSDLIDNYTRINDSYKLDQTFSNRLVAYGEIANKFSSIVVTTIVLVPLTNRFGRKIGLILPSIGNTLLGVLSLLIMKYNLNPYYFILANFLCGIFGGETAYIASTFTYVAEISAPRWRSFRIGAVETAIALGSCAGQFLGGFWFHKIRCEYFPIMMFYIGLRLFILLYVMFLIPESLTRSERDQMRNKNPKGVKEYIEGLRLFSGRLSFSSTWELYIGFIAVNVIVLNKVGAYLVSVYFLKAPPFLLNSLQIGIFQALRSGSQGIANIVFVGALVALKVKDFWIVLVGMSFHGVCNILVGFSVEVWQVYTVAAFQGMEGTVFTGGRSLMSKLVQPEQQGALFSIVASLESVSALISGVAWPLVYPLTLKHNMRSGMTYIFMGGIGIACLPLIMTLFLFKEDPVNNETNQTLSSGSSDSEEEPLLTSINTSYS